MRGVGWSCARRLRPRRVPSLPLQSVEDVARRVEVGRALGEDEADAARLRKLEVAVEHLSLGGGGGERGIGGRVTVLSECFGGREMPHLWEGNVDRRRVANQ